MFSMKKRVHVIVPSDHMAAQDAVQYSFMAGSSPTGAALSTSPLKHGVNFTLGYEQHSMIAKENNASYSSISEIIFLGTGCSDGVPLVSCLTSGYNHFMDSQPIPTNGYPTQPSTPTKFSAPSPPMSPSTFCRVCRDAHCVPGSKNKRRNTSILIRYHPKQSNGVMHRPRNIMIDCGKFFWQSAIEWFPKYNLRFIDAVVLTHHHNDAAYGLDDLRDFTKNVPGHGPIKVFIRENDYKYLSGAFPYLTDRDRVTPGGAVTQLEWKAIDSINSFTVENLEVQPLEIEHGSVRCLGFKFGGVVYLSDVTKIPPHIRDKIFGCELLIIDMLRLERKHPSHFIFPETLQEIRMIRPTRTLLVGMCHEVEHEETNRKLQKLKDTEGLDIQLSYDGMRVPVKL